MGVRDDHRVGGEGCAIHLFRERAECRLRQGDRGDGAEMSEQRARAHEIPVPGRGAEGVLAERRRGHGEGAQAARSDERLRIRTVGGERDTSRAIDAHRVRCLRQPERVAGPQRAAVERKVTPIQSDEHSGTYAHGS